MRWRQEIERRRLCVADPLESLTCASSCSVGLKKMLFRPVVKRAGSLTMVQYGPASFVLGTPGVVILKNPLESVTISPAVADLGRETGSRLRSAQADRRGSYGTVDVAGDLPPRLDCGSGVLRRGRSGLLCRGSLASPWPRSGSAGRTGRASSVERTTKAKASVRVCRWRRRGSRSGRFRSWSTASAALTRSWVSASLTLVALSSRSDGDLGCRRAGRLRRVPLADQKESCGRRS